MDNSTPARRGHEGSPLFKLPAEIRNMIYRETFSGGEVSLVIDPPLTVGVVPVGGRRSVLDTARSFYQLILTCVAAQEAIPIFWSETLVRNGLDGHFSLRYLVSRIPAFAKYHIQHLRAVPSVIPRPPRLLRGAWIRLPFSFADALGHFPKLKTCSIKGRMITSADVAEARVRRPQVQFLVKDLEYEWNVSYQSVLITFKNLSDGTNFRCRLVRHPSAPPIPPIDDEFGFQQLLSYRNPSGGRG